MQALITFGTTLAFMLVLDWKLTLVAMVALPLSVIPSRYIGRASYRARQRVQGKLAEMSVYLQEVLAASSRRLLDPAAGGDVVRVVSEPRLGQLQHRFHAVVGDPRPSSSRAGCSIGYATVVTHASRNSRGRWVLLAYRLPREPSSPRIALWRKLKRLGVAQLLDGLVALPLDSRNREQLEWLADDVVETGGEATIWIGALASAGQERELASAMAEAVTLDYRQVIDAAKAAAGESPGQRRRSLARLRRELRRVRARDYFPPAEREQAQQAVDRLATLVEEPVG